MILTGSALLYICCILCPDVAALLLLMLSPMVIYQPGMTIYEYKTTALLISCCFNHEKKRRNSENMIIAHILNHTVLRRLLKIMFH